MYEIAVSYLAQFMNAGPDFVRDDLMTIFRDKYGGKRIPREKVFEMLENLDKMVASKPDSQSSEI